jgi:SAM-dependent methyltransferase
VPVDTTGKTSLDHIYTQPDPRAYFSTLRELDYRIPQLAKPHFSALVQEYRDACRVAVPTIVDIGCSYGINAALLRCDASMRELYERYAGRAAAGLSRQALLDRDRELVRLRGGANRARFLGLDVSPAALSYAREAGFVDDAVHADLENDDLTEPQRELIARTDLVISTGCLGYITEKTISRVVGAYDGRRPWMAHFVLRMFPFEAVEECLAAAGYETVRSDTLFQQRRFTDAAEQEGILDTLASVGVDPRGHETEGWLYAQLYTSRPRRGPDRVVIDVSPASPHQK